LSPTGAWIRLVVSLVATAASAILCGLAFPTTGWKLLAWVGVAPFLVAIRLSSLGRASLLACVWTLLFWSILWRWGPGAVSTYFLQSKLVGVAFLLGTAILMFLPYHLAFTAAYRALSSRVGASLPLLAAAAWAAAELARGRLFTGTSFFIGNPWGILGYSQVGFDPVMQIASITGIYGVSFVLITVNAAVADFSIELWKRRLLPRRASAGLGLALLVAAGALAFGYAALRAAPGQERTASPVRTAVIQANLGSTSRWRSDLYGRNLDTYLRLTLETLAARDPEIVFWPESAMTFFLERERGYRWAIGKALSTNGAELIAGAPRAVGPGEPDYFNSIYLISGEGEILARYDKEYLVPFAEFSPFREVDLLERRFGPIRQFSAGEPAPPLPTRAGSAGIAVCNEVMFPEIVGRRVAEGAAYLVNPANDSWVPDLQFAMHQFHIASARAVEQRRYLVRASTSGPSAIVDPWGRVQVRTEPFERDVIVGTIRPNTELSVYGRVGDLFGLLCGISVLAALITGYARASRAGRPGGGASSKLRMSR
jgi:apolipoprotein N-acyltransferase